jgi:O-antigen/teichoic acid export membrane protein
MVSIAERVRSVSRFRRVGMEALAVGTGQVVAAIGSVVGVRILTEAMPPREYGELALAMTLGTLGLQVLLAPLTTSALRFFAPAHEAGDLRGFLMAVRRLMVASAGVIGALGVVALIFLFSTSRAVWVGLALGAFVYTLFAGGTAVLDGLQNAARHRVVASCHSGAGPYLRVIAAVGLMYATGRATSGIAIAGYAIGTAIVFASQVYFIVRQIVPLAGSAAIDERRWIQAMLRYGWPFAAWGIFTWAQMASDRWALGLFGTAADVGYYAVLYQLGFYPILTASMLIGQVLSPLLFARAGDASNQSRVTGAVRLNAQMAGIMLGLTVLGTAVAAAVHPLVGRLLLAEQYRGMTHYLPWVVLAGGAFATGQIMSTFFMISNRSSALAVPKIVTAVAGVLMNFAGAKWFGIRGVIGASILFGVIYCAWVSTASWLALRRLGGQEG